MKVAMKFSFSFGTFIIRLLNIWCDAWHGPFLSLVMCMCVCQFQAWLNGPLFFCCLLLMLLFVSLLCNTEFSLCVLTNCKRCAIILFFFCSSCVAVTVAHSMLFSCLNICMLGANEENERNKHGLQKCSLLPFLSHVCIFFALNVYTRRRRRLLFFNLIRRNFPFI